MLNSADVSGCKGGSAGGNGGEEDDKKEEGGASEEGEGEEGEGEGDEAIDGELEIPPTHWFGRGPGGSGEGAAASGPAGLARRTAPVAAATCTHTQRSNVPRINRRGNQTTQRVR